MKRKHWIQRGLCFALMGCMLFLSMGASDLRAAEELAQGVLLSAEGRDISCLTLGQIPDSLCDTLQLDSLEAEKQAVALDVTDADSLNSITTINQDGSRSVYAFAQPIKYVDHDTNRIEFIDNDWESSGMLKSLLSGTAYTNKTSDVKISLPGSLSGGICVEWGAEAMRSQEEEPSGSDATSVLVAGSGQTTEQTVSPADNRDYTFRMIPVTDASARAAREDDSPFVCYENAFGEGTRLEYKAVHRGVKENLVLERNPGMNEFAFIIDAPGLVPGAAQGNTMEFYDEQTGDLAVTLTQPWAMDSRRASEDAADTSTACATQAAAGMQTADETSATALDSAAGPVEDEAQPASEGPNLCLDLGYRVEPAGEGKYRLTMYIDPELFGGSLHGLSRDH